MTNDKQVEVWKKEFEDWADAKCYYLDLQADGNYYKASTRLAWEIWQESKRSMQPIELPDSDDYFDKFETNIYGYESAVHEAITAAGYSYRVKE